MRNRLFITPHATMFASDDRNNLPGSRLAYYCAERAKGGIGLLEVSMAIVDDDLTSQASPSSEAHFSPLNAGHPMTLSGRWPIRGSDPGVIEGYSKLARMVHSYNSKVFMELASAGSNLGATYGVSSFTSPAGLPFSSREMNEEAIEKQVESYGIASKYVMKSGLDGVDILTSHGELLGEFISAVMNRRTDKYGGSLENRLRFLEQVIQRIREYVGNNIAVGMRLNGDERFQDGNTPGIAADIARRLDGKLDWVTTDIGYSPQQEGWQAPPLYVDSGYNLKVTSPVKDSVNLTKVGAVGRYIDPYFGERLLEQGLADMVAMTRATIADPELPRKALEGRIDDIRPCIGTLQDCWGRMKRGLPISCTVNPIVGREQEWGIGSINSAAIKKKILIVGGGPAGLEAARVATERGHQVVIYEKETWVGGQAILAGKLPGRADIRAIIYWQQNQLKKLETEIKLGLEVTTDPKIIEFVLDEEKPDAVVIATGSSSIRDGFQAFTFSSVDGSTRPNVLTDIDVLKREENAFRNRNIIMADSLGFIEAPGIAELLAKQGANVEIITLHASVGLELMINNHYEHVIPRLFALGVKLSPFTWVKEIGSNWVSLYNVFQPRDTRRVENIDYVVLITGKCQNDSLFQSFKSKVKELYLIGDANVGGSRIGNAIYDGHRVGRMI